MYSHAAGSSRNKVDKEMDCLMGGEFRYILPYIYMSVSMTQIHACVWLSPFAVHQKLSQHCESAILQYKIKSLKQKGWMDGAWSQPHRMSDTC